MAQISMRKMWTKQEISIQLASDMRELNDPNDVFEYTEPTRDVKLSYYDFKMAPGQTQKAPDLPGRIKSPIIAYLPEMLQYLENDDHMCTNKLSVSYQETLGAIKGGMLDLKNKLNLEGKLEIKHGMRDILEASADDYGLPMANWDETIKQISKQFVSYELEIASALGEDFERSKIDDQLTGNIKIPSILRVCQAMKASYINGKTKRSTVLFDNSYTKGTVETRNDIYGNFITYRRRENQDVSFYIIRNAHFTMLYKGRDQHILFMDSDRFNYLITCAEISLNKQIICSSSEFKWAKEVLSTLEELYKNTLDYNGAVEFIKSFESLCLMMSDIKDSDTFTTLPLTDLVISLSDIQFKDGLNSKLGKIETVTEILYLILNDMKSTKINYYLAQMIVKLNQLNGLQLQSISSAHKFYYYALINEDKGLSKFLKRVHTKRPCNPTMVEQKTMLAKRNFCIAFSKRHKEPPNILYPPEKKKTIHEFVKMNKFRQLELQVLNFWADIKFGPSIDIPMIGDVMEFAKDSGALKNQVKHGPGDSRAELLQILELQEYKLETRLPKQLDEAVTQTVTEVNQGTMTHSGVYITKLMMKEREQKEEGRLFGVANLKLKHTLSYAMECCKKALGYFDGQMMTKSDKDKQDILHKMAQLTNDPKIMSVLLDIEGHNQSMQPQNTSSLCSFIADITGCEVLRDFPNLFQNLHVYYYDKYRNRATISKGQLGGIEGWGNPIWTLDTMLVVALMKFELGVNMPMIATYSDDVNALMLLDSTEKSYINNLLKQIRRHFREHGFIVKLSQTVISNNRVTLLRQHYHKGKKSDSTIKKLFAVSMFTDLQVLSDSKETSAIVSSTTSALERSNHPMTCLFMKWYRVLLLNLPAFVAYIKVSREDSLISSDEFPLVIGRIRDSKKDDNARFFGIDEKTWRKKVFDSIAKNHLTDPNFFSKKQSIMAYLNGLKLNPQQLRSTDAEEILIHGLSSKSGLWEWLFLLYCMPESYGGCGTTLFINEIVSGHSNGAVKALYYLKEWASRENSRLEKFHSLMKAHLILPKPPDKIKGLGKLVATEYPLHSAFPLSSAVIRKYIVRGIKKVIKNKSIIKYFKFSESSDEFANLIGEHLKSKFDDRVARYYYDKTPVYIMNILLKKIETSQSFFGAMHRDVINECRIKLHQNNLDHHIHFFKKNTGSKSTYSPTKHVIPNLIDYRASLYPTVCFVNIVEPLYDSTLIKTRCALPDITIATQPEATTLKNNIYYRDPLISSPIGEKFDRSERPIIFDSIEQHMIYDIVKVTKWILYKSSLDGKDDQWYYQGGSNIEQLCNHLLSIYTDIGYRELHPFIALPYGGEIRHRLRTVLFNTNVALRFLPNKATGYQIIINNTNMSIKNLVDSNINFDYLRYRLIAAAAVREVMINKGIFYEKLNIKCDETIKDVRIDFCAEELDYEYQQFWDSPGKNDNLGELFAHRIKYLSSLEVANGQSSLNNLIIAYHGGDSTSLSPDANIGTVALAHSHLLIKEQVSIGIEYDETERWKPFINTMKPIIPRWRSESDDSIFNEIKERAARTIKDNVNAITTKYDFYEDALLKDYLRSKGNIGADDYMKYIVEIRGLSAYMIPIRAIKNAKERQRRLDDFNESRGKILSRIYRYITYDLCLQFALILIYEPGSICMNRVATYELITSAINTRHSMNGINTEMNSLLTYASTNLPSDLIDLYVGETLDEINSYIKEFDFKGLLMRLDPIQSQECINLDMRECIENIKDISVNYDSSEIQLDFVNQNQNLRQMLSWARVQHETYSNPEIYESPTGSEALYPQIGLFRSYLRDGLLNPTSRVIDMCAGRGDGHLALTYLNIDHSSYTTGDQYQKLKHVSGINSQKNYDLFVPGTWPEVGKADMIHADISYTSVTNHTLADLINECIKRDFILSIRVNSIISLLEEGIGDIDKELFECKLYECISVPNTAYQAYLVIVKKDPKMTIDPAELETINRNRDSRGSGYGFRVMKRVLQNKALVDLNVPLSIKPNDSYAEKISNTLQLETVLNHGYQDRLGNSDRELSNNISNYLIKTNQIPWTLPQYPEDRPPKAESEIEKEDINKYLGIVGKDVISKSRRPRNVHRKYRDHLNRMIESPQEIHWVSLLKIHVDDLRYLSRKHPLYLVRDTVSSLLKLIERGRIKLKGEKGTETVDETSLLRALEEIKASNESHINTDSMLAKRALSLLAVSMQAISYDDIILTIRLAQHIPGPIRAHYVQLMAYFRRYSWIKQKWENEHFDRTKMNEFVKQYVLEREEIRSRLNVNARKLTETFREEEELDITTLELKRVFEILQQRMLKFTDETFISIENVILNAKDSNILNDENGDTKFKLKIEGLNTGEAIGQTIGILLKDQIANMVESVTSNQQAALMFYGNNEGRGYESSDGDNDFEYDDDDM